MNWTLDKINEYIINKIEENLNLDYKAASSLEKVEKKTNEVSKDISAFANSDGGIIIYGIKEDKENKHVPGEIDPINREIITKEWLEQIIQGKIRPRIEGIVITPIEVNNSVKEVIYVVDIPKSNTAHQADDKKYYKRFNFNSEPMYDYEIRDILNRSKNPEIDLEFEILKNTYEVAKPYNPILPSWDKFGNVIKHEPKKEYKTEYTLKIYAKNNGIVLANYINAYYMLRDDLLVDDKNSSAEFRQFFADNTIRDVVDTTVLPSFDGARSIPKYGPSRYDPILPRRRMKVESDAIKEIAIGSENEIIWIVYADNAEPRKGRIKFKDILIKLCTTQQQV
jgi:hypothetical protein